MWKKSTLVTVGGIPKKPFHSTVDFYRAFRTHKKYLEKSSGLRIRAARFSPAAEETATGVNAD